MGESKAHPRQYYEIWGDLIGALKFHRRLNVLLGLIVVLAIVWSIIHALKPPLVVRVDEVGEAVCLRTYLTDSNPSTLEARRFNKEFLRYFMEVNSTTVASDFAEAAAMMTNEYAEPTVAEWKAQKLVTTLSKAGVKSDLEILESNCKERGEEYYICTTQGVMTTRSLYTKKQSKRGFTAEATLVKVPRGERTPNGLLLADFENQYHELGEKSAGSAALDRAGLGANP